jgi:hypothetical protein
MMRSVLRPVMYRSPTVQEASSSKASKQVQREAFTTLLSLYSREAAAGYFGSGAAVESQGWIVDTASSVVAKSNHTTLGHGQCPPGMVRW